MSPSLSAAPRLTIHDLPLDMRMRAFPHGLHLRQAASNANQPSARAPSAILGAVAVTQLQFLATLSLVDDTGGEDSSLPGFADNFR